MEKEDNVFEIESVLDSLVKKGARYYRVRWKGFGEDEDTWEPEENLFDCKDVLDEYCKKTRKNKQAKVKKRKSESTSQSQTNKAKKKKSGRTTNNSTIARIDSSSSQDENIIFPETTSSVKHAKTKRKHELDKEMDSENKRLDTSQEHKRADKSKGNTVKRKKSKKDIAKHSSLESKLDQPRQAKQLLDENENPEDTNINSGTFISPEKNTPVVIIEDEPDSRSTRKESSLQRENSRENLKNRGLGKRRSWSSFEASPEYVPEYCDETLAYDICSEEEFEYFGDTAYFVKDSIGYEEINFEATEALAIDEGHVKDDDDHVKDDEDHVKDNEDHVKDDESHVKDDEGHVTDDEGHVEDDDDHVKDEEGHVNDDEDLVKDDEDHVNDDEVHVKDDEDHVNDDEDHVKDDEDHVNDDEDHVEDDVDHVEDDVDHVEDDVDHVEDDEDHLNDDEDHVKDDENHVNGGEDHVNGDEDHVEDDEDHVNDGEDHVNGDEDHVEDDEDHVNDDEDHVKDDEDHLEDVEDHVNDDEGHLNDESKTEAVSPGKEIGTEEQKQREDNEKSCKIPPVSSLDTTANTLEAEYPLSSSTSKDIGIEERAILKDDNIRLFKEGDIKLTDRNADCLNSKTTPALTSETGTSPEKNTVPEPKMGRLPPGFSAPIDESGDVLKTHRNDDIGLNQSLFCVGSDKTVNVDHKMTQRKDNLKLRMRSSSSGDSTDLTDSECMSPEFGKLTEPQKGVFDTIFAARMGDGNATEELTHEKENKGNEIRKDNCKDEPGNTDVQEVCRNDSCHEPKRESHTEDREKDRTEIVENKIEGNVQSVYSKGEPVNHSQILELKTADSSKLNSVEMKEESHESEKNSSHGVLLDISQDKPVSNADDVREKTCLKASLSPIDKNRKLSDEETAYCLLDLSCVKPGITNTTENNERKVQSPSEGHMKNSKLTDLSKLDKLDVGEEVSGISNPPASLARNKDKNESKQQLFLKRKSDENKNEDYGRKNRLLLNIPFIEEGSKEVLCLLDINTKPAQESVKNLREKYLSSTESESENETESENESESESEAVSKSQCLPATDESRASVTDPVVTNESQIKQNVSVVTATATSESSLVKVTSSIAAEQKSASHSENAHQKTPKSPPNIKKNETHPVPNEESSSKNTSERKPELIVVGKIETEKDQKTDSVTSSSMEKNKSDLVSSQQSLTKTQEEHDSVKAEKGLHPQYTQTTTGSSVSLKQSSPSGSHDATITKVYGKGRYEAYKQGNDSVSWSGDTSKTYPYSAQFGPPSVNHINQNLYSAGANPFIVSHLNQKGFSPQPNFPFTNHFNQQPQPRNPVPNLVNQKPFSAVAGINWYPENHPRLRLIAPPMFVPRPLYFVPSFPTSPQYSQQVLQNNMYARALQEMAEKRQPENLGQSVSTGFNNKEYSSSIDADRAWYAKHVGSTSTVNSSQNIKTEESSTSLLKEHKAGENIISQAEMRTKVTSDISRSNNVKVSILKSKSKDDFSSAIVKTHSSMEKTDTKSSLAEANKGHLSASPQSGSCVVKEKESSSKDKEGECSTNKHEFNKKDHAEGRISGETSVVNNKPISKVEHDSPADTGRNKHGETTEKTVSTKETLEATSVKGSKTTSQSKAGSSLSTNSTKPLDLTVSKSATNHSTDTGSAITQSKDKAIDKDKVKRKDKPTSNSESNKKLTSHSIPNSKQSFLKETKPSTNNKSENRSSANSSRSGSKEKERSRDSSSKDQKQRRNDSEKTRSKEISQKKEVSSKTSSRSKEENRRSKRDTKGKELKKQESDSEVEFDLDDYSPGEMITHKPEIMEITQSGIPTAMSLREVKFAIKQGNSATVLASLAGGMNIDSQDSVTGMTLLMRAVSSGQENIVKLLLNHGANINIKDNTGSTPLIAACEQDFENIVSLLLSVETDINAKQTLSGETALIKACMKGHYSVVAMLLAHGADCQMRSVSGLTAAQLAVQCGHFEIRDLLESHSKKLQRGVETAIASCLCDSSKLMYPPLLPFVSLYPSEGQKFTYHFHCSDMLLSKTILLFCLRAVFSRSGQVDLSFSKDNGVHTVLLNGSIQSPVLPNNKSVFVLQPKMDTNRLILQTYQSHVHLLVCIYAAEVDENIESSATTT